jgi:hypothetical protein
MRPTLGQQRGKGRDVDPGVAGGIKLDGVGGDGQERGRLLVAQGAAQGQQRLALGQVGPQQPDQRLTAMRAIRLHGQVGQQGTDLVVLERSDGFPIALQLIGPQKVHTQARHGVLLAPGRGRLMHIQYTACGLGISRVCWFLEGPGDCADVPSVAGKAPARSERYERF